MNRGNWTDNECYYVSIMDGKRFNVVAGPFETHQESLDMVKPANKIGTELDRKSWFYGWGTVKMDNGYTEGMLNSHLDI